MENKDVPEIFQYTRPEVPEDCICTISPSQIEKFFTFPKIWYSECYLGNKPEFKGNTSSVIGIISHYIYKCVTENIPITREDINQQLLDYLNIEPNPDVDATQVMSLYPLITKEVVNNYVIPHNNLGCVIKCEQPITAKVVDGAYIAGTYDRLEGTVLCDYKNVSVKPNETCIPFGYKMQLLAYAYALRQHGYEVDRIRLIYGIRPTKTLPARCIVVTEEIDYKADKLVKDTLELIAESVLIVREKPELTHLIFKSMDLKQGV